MMKEPWDKERRMMLKGQKELNLVILAAGIGSRFGGIKQLCSVGPNGETIIDYSLFDALRAGFRRVVFIIRREIEAEFREVIGRFWEKRVEVDYAFQELTSLLPPNWYLPQDRTKPWGTGQALLVAEEKISNPLAVINADDFYGQKAFEIMAFFLNQVKIKGQTSGESFTPEYALAGYRLKHTLSDFGPVCRGLCFLEGEKVVNIKEMKHIEKKEKGARGRLENGRWLELQGDEVVSMNFWGFDPSIFGFLHCGFEDFLKNFGHDPKAEFLIPDFVGELIRQKRVRVHYLPTEDQWFGITYPEDLRGVRVGIARLIARGIYPTNLKADLEEKIKS